MSIANWRERAALVMEQKKLTMRTVSLRMGSNASYLFTVMKKGQDPVAEKIIEIARALEVSPVWLMFGFNLDPEAEEVVLRYQALDEEKRKMFRKMLEAIAPDPSVPASDQPIPSYDSQIVVDQITDP